MPMRTMQSFIMFILWLFAPFVLLPILCVLHDRRFELYAFHTIMILLSLPDYLLQTICTCMYLSETLHGEEYEVLEISNLNCLFHPKYCHSTFHSRNLDLIAGLRKSEKQYLLNITMWHTLGPEKHLLATMSFFLISNADTAAQGCARMIKCCTRIAETLRNSRRKISAR